MSSPFITYDGSEAHAEKDVESTREVFSLPPKIWASPTTSDLRFVLRNHVDHKKGKDMIFIKALAHLYALTKLLTALKFPESARLSKKAQSHLNNIRNLLLMKSPYAIDTFKTDHFGEDNSTTEEIVARRRELSMNMGILGGILNRHDQWKLELYKRQSREGPRAEEFTELEIKDYKQTIEDCFFVSRDLLGELTDRIDKREDAQA